jgi:hypothetical protein
MIVENDADKLGKMTFYEVPLDSETKLLGPTSVREALDRDPDFAQLKTLLRNPRIGDNILYRVGDQDTYFIPVYTAGAGGSVAQLGTIAAVGAGFTGEYYVGLGETQEEAFEAYLQKLSGVVSTSKTGETIIQLDKDERFEKIMEMISNSGLTITKPTAIQIPLSFEEGEIVFFNESDKAATEEMINEFMAKYAIGTSRVLMWEEDSSLYFGVINTVDGIAEIHYIKIQIGKD